MKDLNTFSISGHRFINNYFFFCIPGSCIHPEGIFRSSAAKMQLLLSKQISLSILFAIFFQTHQKIQSDSSFG